MPGDENIQSHDGQAGNGTPSARHDDNEIRDEIESLKPWFHNLHLPSGEQTAPDHWLGDFPTFKWKQIEPYIPHDLHGWRVLDIGCNAGYYSFQLAERGATVTAIDVSDHYLSQAKWAADLLGLSERIEFRHMQIYELARTPDEYDLVWFMGVLYHLRHPLLALDIVRRKTHRQMVLQTLTLPGRRIGPATNNLSWQDRNRMCDPDWPFMAFIEHRLASDPTNWWAANENCVEAMLRSSGFEVIGYPTHEVYLCKPTHPDEVTENLAEAELMAVLGINGISSDRDDC